jgi:hypothetical protein
MASYTNDLRLKEITTGDEDGTWGTSTNTNLALIADAFGLGTKQMAANADETFTMPDATADGTRALYLKITSAVSLTTTRTVTLAPNTVSKVWIIENATTGSQSITIAQGSGATVTIATGATAMVYTDGAGAGGAVVNTGVVTAASTTTLTNKTLTDPALIGTALEDVYTISDGAAFEVDPGNGSIQLITLGANRTPKATNFAAGEAITLMVDDGSAYTLTWTDATWGASGVVWKTDGGVAPSLNTTGYTVITFWKVSTQVYGARVGNA